MFLSIESARVLLTNVGPCVGPTQWRVVRDPSLMYAHRVSGWAQTSGRYIDLRHKSVCAVGPFEWGGRGAIDREVRATRHAELYIRKARDASLCVETPVPRATETHNGGVSLILA